MKPLISNEATAEVPREAADLLKKIAAGNEDAMKAFFYQYSQNVYRYLLGQCHDEMLASDVLNDVMMNVWKQAAKFEGRSKITTWLIGIARNKLIDHYRKEKRHLHDDLDDALADPIAINEQAIQTEQQGKWIKVCADKLIEKQREIVHFTFYSDLNYQEIAEIIQRPVGTVKSRMFHAKESMRKCLSRLLIEENGHAL